MRVRPAVLVLLLFGLVPSLVQALALGEITWNSGLNEPLDAEIELIAATPEEIKNLTATVASRETFERYGLDRPDFLSGLRFVVARSDSRDILRVVSTQPVSEPFVTFLVEAQWRRGRLLREYTVLLDPPVFLPTPERVAPVAAPRSVPSQTRPSSGQIAREPQPRRSAPPPRTYSSSPPAFGSDYGPIRRNETLWGIAERLRTDRSITMNQMMVAIYQANQQAFLGNINLMKEGSTLRIPTRSAIESVSQQNAFATAVAHNEAWRAGRPTQVATAGTAPSTIRSTPESDRLRLIEPEGTPGGTSVAGAAGGAADAGTRETLARNQADIQRLAGENDQLRADLEEIRRLLSVRDTQLADLQRQFAADATDGGPAIVPVQTDTQTDAIPDDATAGTDSAVETLAGDTTGPATDDSGGVTAQTDGSTAPDTAGDDTATDGAEEAVAAVPVQTQSLPDEPGILAKLGGAAKSALGSLWLWIALGLVALAAFAMVALRGRATGKEDAIEALTREAQVSAPAADAAVTARVKTADDSAPASSDVEFFDDSGTFKPVDFAAAQASGAESGEYPFEDTIGGEIKLDQSDPLAEADFHMAYGLYDQASDLVKKAVARNPKRLDLRMKLLEIFFVWGNQDEFRATALDLRENMPEQIAGEWDKIVIMGKQICPDDPLFAGDAGMGASADIDLEFAPTGSQAAVDLDTGGEQLEADSIDLDFGGALDAAPDIAPVAADDSDTSNDLLDLDFGDDMLSGLDEDEGEDDATRPEPVQEIKDKIRARLSSTDTEETAEMDLSDLGVDLDLAGAAPAEDEAPVSDPTVENEFGDFFDLPDSPADATSELPAPTAELTAGAGLDLDIGEMFGGLDSEDADETARDLTTLEESMEQTGPAPGDDTADTGHFSAEVETLHGDALDVDISGFGDATPDSSQTIDGDEPTGSHTDDAFSAQVFGPDESDETKMIGPDSEPAAAQGEDTFSAAVFGEDETVQVSGVGNGMDDEDVFGGDAGLDLDIGDALPEGDDKTTAKVATSDLALPDGGDELSEVGTKLDLARAYMDMGDPDGARGILEEVLAEGNENQQADAREMLSSLT